MPYINITDFFSLRHTLPVIDVRSPSEFFNGHITGATNIPLLTDDERTLVGTTYKHNGQQEAIKEGFRLVGPRLSQLIDATEKVANKKEILVYCWRGGMRSKNFCCLMEMANIGSFSLKDGYKAYRQLAIESFKKSFQFILLGGCTGSGKSEILRALGNAGEQILDLEHMANHKGSTFGGLMMPPQPSTEQFQNLLFEEIIKFDLSKRIWVENESLAIGKIFLPTYFWKTMTHSPVVKIEVDKEIRIARLVKEYGASDATEFIEMMGKVIKKLGGQNYNMAKEKILQNDMFATIDILLTYYDKAYLTGLQKKVDRTLFSITWNGKIVSEFVKEIIRKLNTLSVQNQVSIGLEQKF